MVAGRHSDVDLHQLRMCVYVWGREKDDEEPGQENSGQDRSFPATGRVLMSNIAVATTLLSICVSSFPASTC